LKLTDPPDFAMTHQARLAGGTMDAFEAALADLEALRADLPVEGDSGLTVLDSKRVNALLFSQGSWKMVARDLLAAK
jgi:hypothetical protein